MHSDKGELFVKGLLSAVGVSLASYWDALPEMLRTAATAAAILLIFDTVLGVMRALCEGTYSSEGIARFFKKFIVYVCVFGSAYAIDMVLNSESFAQSLIAFMIVFTEISSVMENSEALGFKWPAKIREKIAILSEAICDTQGDYDDKRDAGDGSGTGVGGEEEGDADSQG